MKQKEITNLVATRFFVFRKEKCKPQTWSRDRTQHGLMFHKVMELSPSSNTNVMRMYLSRDVRGSLTTKHDKDYKI